MIKKDKLQQIFKIGTAFLLAVGIVACHGIFGLTPECTFISAVSLLYLACFAPAVVFGLVFLAFASCWVLDFHLYSVYGSNFTEMGEQLINVTATADKMEVLSYLYTLSALEIFLICFVLFSSFYFMKIKPFHSDKYGWTAIFLCVFLFGYQTIFWEPYHNNLGFFKSEKAIIDKKNRFRWNLVVHEKTPQNVILIVGETHRYDYFTKYWNQKPKINHLLSFEDMIAQWGYTQKAMPQILSRKQFHEKTVCYYESSVFKLYEQAGYETHFVSYLPPLWKSDNSISFITLDSQHYHKYAKNNGVLVENDIISDDKEAGKILESIMSNGKKNFIVVKLIGVHPNFQNRYPDEYDLLKPSLKEKALHPEVKYKQIFLNSYENAMHYSVDTIYDFFKLAENRKDSTLMLFSSDHGINLFDDDSWYISSVKGSFHIPFLIYGNPAFMEKVNAEKWHNVQNNLASPLIENDILETMASLSDIEIKNSRNRDLTKSTKISGSRKVMTVGSGETVYEEMEK